MRASSIMVALVLALGGCTRLFGDRIVGHRDAGLDSDCACNAPPKDVCLDTTVLRAFAAVGSCSESSCRYDYWDTLCENGCSDGACTGNDPCDGIECTTPPAPSCTSATALTTYSQDGTCSHGTCSYVGLQTSCSCSDGACSDPCAGLLCDTPPSSLCVDTSTLRSFTTPGACVAGGCEYVPADVSCPSGCAGGHCTGDLCAGVSCTQPPAPACLDAATRRSYSSSGTCANGTCSYAPVDTTCSMGCQGGVCTGDPCAGVSCDTPPPPTCSSASTRRAFATSGTCTSGSCSYAPTDTGCTAPTNATPSCVGGSCDFNCVQGYIREGSSCAVSMSMPDGGTPPNGTPGQVACGQTSCSSPSGCCFGDGGDACTDLGDCPGDSDNTYATCDGPEDCPGAHCCAAGGLIACDSIPLVALFCANGAGQWVCRGDADCQGNTGPLAADEMKCCPSNLPGISICSSC